jgi:transcriptional regulator with XRE-family HTH domain
MTQQGETLSDAVAGRVQRLRKGKGWSVARLAAECAKAGAPHLNANVLTNLLARQQRRRDVTVDEAAALARALGVPFYRLLPPAVAPSTERLDEAEEILDRIQPLLSELAGELEKMGGTDG